MFICSKKSRIKTSHFFLFFAWIRLSENFENKSPKQSCPLDKMWNSFFDIELSSIFRGKTGSSLKLILQTNYKTMNLTCEALEKWTNKIFIVESKQQQKIFISFHSALLHKKKSQTILIQLLLVQNWIKINNCFKNNG